MNTLSPNPRVSVVMAVRNCANFVGASVESILNQTMADFEIIVVDDCSSDRTRCVLDRIEDIRVRKVFLNQNIGAAGARNIAIRLSNAQYIAIQDADDVSLPTRLQIQLEVLDSDPHLEVVGSQLREFGDWGGPAVSSWPSSEREVASMATRRKMPLAHPSAVFRKEALERVGLYDEVCLRSEDYGLILKMAGSKMLVINESLVHYRTVRPLPIRYALESGQWAAVARARVDGRSTIVGPRSLGLWELSVVNVRSLGQWLKRRMRERSE